MLKVLWVFLTVSQMKTTCAAHKGRSSTGASDELNLKSLLIE
jgi:hypothetical protein